MSRLDRAIELCDRVRQVGDGRFEVPGTSTLHVVTLGHPAPTCDCEDHQYRRCACAHIQAAQLFVEWQSATAASASEATPEPTPPADRDDVLLKAVQDETREVLVRVERKLEALDARHVPETTSAMLKYARRKRSAATVTGDV